MKVTVEMSFDELKEFIKWKEDKKMYQRQNREDEAHTTRLARKVVESIEHNPLCAGECVIVNQDKANELLDMAAEIFM